MDRDKDPGGPAATVTAGATYWSMRLGAVAAVTGAICAGAGNLLHPITPRDDQLGVAEVISQSQRWTIIHLVIAAGILLMLAGLSGIRRSICDGGIADALAEQGMQAATIGAMIGMITIVLDGVAAKQLADQWAAAPPSAKPVALAMVSTNETINFALAGLFNAAFAGVPFLLFGLAIVHATAYPSGLGWVAVAAGTGSIAAGTFQAMTGEPTVASLVLTILGPTAIVLWLLTMGILLWHRSGDVNKAPT
jgi:hypothetical protein